MRLLSLLLLAGCAVAPQQPQVVPSTVLCYLQAAGTPDQRDRATGLLASRATSCNGDMVAIGERQYLQARQNAAQQASTQQQWNDLGNMGLFLLTQPPPATPAPPVHCRTVYYGKESQTICH